MKKLLLASVALIGFTGGAFAADLPVRTVAPPPPVYVAYNWTGFYIGAQIGYQWGETEGTSFPPGLNYRYDTDGFIGGVHAGYNWQLNQFVLGVEADIEYQDDSGNGLYALGAFRHTTSGNWQGSLRARVGVAFDRTLFYVTGGLAYQDSDHSFGPAVGPALLNYNASRWGWTVGAGIEHAFAPNWTARIEGRYTDPEFATGTLGPFLDTSTVESFSVRVGISYRFGGPVAGPAVVKY